jgi:hypothetical protein
MVQQKVPKEIEAGEQVTANLTIRRNLLRHTLSPDNQRKV